LSATAKLSASLHTAACLAITALTNHWLAELALQSDKRVLLSTNRHQSPLIVIIQHWTTALFFAIAIFQQISPAKG